MVMNNVTDFTITATTENHKDFTLTLNWTAPANTNQFVGYHLYQAESMQDTGERLGHTITETTHVIQFENLTERVELFYYILPVYTSAYGIKSDTIRVIIGKTVVEPYLRIHYGIKNASMRTFSGEWTTTELRQATGGTGLSEFAEIEADIDVKPRFTPEELVEIYGGQNPDLVLGLEPLPRSPYYPYGKSGIGGLYSFLRLANNPDDYITEEEYLEAFDIPALGSVGSLTNMMVVVSASETDMNDSTITIPAHAPGEFGDGS